MLVPRFVAHFRDVNIAKIENGMEPREVISSGQKRQRYRHTEKADEHWSVFPKRPFDPANAKPTESVSIWLTPKKIKIKWQTDQQLGSIAKSQSEKRSSYERRRPHQGKIKRCGLAHESQTESDLPCAAESEITPCPGSKNWKQRHQNATG